MRERMRRTASIQIAIVDDHEVVRQGLRLSLELEADMAVVGEARTGTEAIDLARQRQPDVMLLDVRLGDLDGPEVCRRVLDVAPRTAARRHSAGDGRRPARSDPSHPDNCGDPLHCASLLPRACADRRTLPHRGTHRGDAATSHAHR